MRTASRSKHLVAGSIRTLPWLLVVALSGLNVLYMSRLGPNDDACITYRVVRNQANGLGLVFSLGELVGGTDGWRVDQVQLLDTPVYTVELHNQRDAFTRVAHVALVEPSGVVSLEDPPTQ